MAFMQAITPRPAPAEARLLLVEDEPELRTMLETLLTEEGYLVDGAADGQRALHLGLTRHYDVIVLDRKLPGIDGLDVVGRWRRSGRSAPVLVLSALGTPPERVAGLDAGAEDYLSKPFDIDELLARLRALRRRHLDTARQLPVGDGLLDLDAREFRPDRSGGAQPVPLSERECELLAALAARPGRVFSREDLLLTVFTEAESPIVVDTYVHYLRRKLGRDVIRTIRGRGYRLGQEAGR
jgi:DNA-binding response OmpR family regulator